MSDKDVKRIVELVNGAVAVGDVEKAYALFKQIADVSPWTIATLLTPSAAVLYGAYALTKNKTDVAPVDPRTEVQIMDLPNGNQEIKIPGQGTVVIPPLLWGVGQRFRENYRENPLEAVAEFDQYLKTYKVKAPSLVASSTAGDSAKWGKNEVKITELPNGDKEIKLPLSGETFILPPILATAGAMLQANYAQDPNGSVATFKKFVERYSKFTKKPTTEAIAQSQAVSGPVPGAVEDELKNVQPLQNGIIRQKINYDATLFMKDINLPKDILKPGQTDAQNDLFTMFNYRQDPLKDSVLLQADRGIQLLNSTIYIDIDKKTTLRPTGSGTYRSNFSFPDKKISVNLLPRFENNKGYEDFSAGPMKFLFAQ
jgi:hypothetical protein